MRWLPFHAGVDAPDLKAGLSGRDQRAECERRPISVRPMLPPDRFMQFRVVQLVHICCAPPALGFQN